MKNITYFLTILAAPVLFFGCASYHHNQGNRAFDRYAYAKAIEHYEKALDRKDIPEARIGLAESYRKINHPGKALLHYAEVVEMPESEDVHKLHYAKLLMCEEDYEEAKQWLVKYLKNNPENEIAQHLVSSCDIIDSLYEDSAYFDVELVSVEGITSAFSPVPYKKGIVFAAEKDPDDVALMAESSGGLLSGLFGRHKENPWTGNSFLDLYYTEKNDSGEWKNPQALQGEIKGQYHQGSASFNDEGNLMYFTRSNYFKRKLRRSANNENNLKIFKAKLEDDKWNGLEELYVNSDEYSSGHPWLTSDSILYFISDMPGGYGGTDIYRIKCDGKQCYHPENLGPEVNTPGNEMFPFFHDRTQTLYFSSDAHLNMGGLDVFSSVYNGENWSTPENMRYPVNTSRDDFGFVLKEDGKMAYLASNRFMQDQIYALSLRDPVLKLAGTVTDKETGEPLPAATIELMDTVYNEKLYATTDENGKYQLRLEQERNYRINCSMQGYFSVTGKVTTVNKERSENFKRDFELQQMEVDKPVVLKNIYYDFDKANIREDAKPALDKLSALLLDNPDIEVELSAHCDCRGSDAYNFNLSQKRAQSVVDYLVNKGVSEEMLHAKGYGESQPVNDCFNGRKCREGKHQMNRRTEFKVLGLSNGEVVSTE